MFMRAANIFNVFNSFDPLLPQGPIHPSLRLHQNFPRPISAKSRSSVHLHHNSPHCALLRPASDHGKSKDGGGGEYHCRPFDVFLSFHGPDARHTIVDHLDAALRRKGIKPFKDETELQRGLPLKDAISAAIRDSTIYLLVLSQGYASSSFCMDEAFETMHRCCCCDGGRVLLPIFYLISPADVCCPLAGCFKEQFLSHYTKYPNDHVQRWISAFNSIGQIKGWVHTNGGSEALLVEEVSTKIVQLVRTMRSAYYDDHMELANFLPQISSAAQGSARIIRIPKPDYVANHDANYHGHSLQLCLVAQHYSLPGASNCQLDLTTIATEARRRWKDEEIQVEPLHATTTTTTDRIIIRFRSGDTRNWVLESSPWLFHNSTQLFFMRKWNKGQSSLWPSSALLMTIPVWVRLYNVPEEYMNPKGLIYIASCLGQPVYVDRATADYYRRRHSSNNRQILPYAKVCVEISAKDEAIDTFRRSGERAVVIAIGDEKENQVIVTAFYQLEEDGQEELGW